MKIYKNITIAILVCFLSFPLLGQEAQQEPAASPPKPAKSLAQGLGLFIFPSQDQTAEQQSTDEYACYKWAMQQTGYNPLDPPEIKAEQVNTNPDGSAVVGAAGGAAAGAAIGAIAGDAGKGAAIGAVVGGLRGRRAKKYGDAVEQQKADQSAAQQSEALLNDFKKAFMVCMEGKNYTVK